jgi:hypothetical protein
VSATGLESRGPWVDVRHVATAYLAADQRVVRMVTGRKHVATAYLAPDQRVVRMVTGRKHVAHEGMQDSAALDH